MTDTSNNTSHSNQLNPFTVHTTCETIYIQTENTKQLDQHLVSGSKWSTTLQHTGIYIVQCIKRQRNTATAIDKVTSWNVLEEAEVAARCQRCLWCGRCHTSVILPRCTAQLPSCRRRSPYDTPLASLPRSLQQSAVRPSRLITHHFMQHNTTKRLLVATTTLLVVNS